MIKCEQETPALFLFFFFSSNEFPTLSLFLSQHPATTQLNQTAINNLSTSPMDDPDAFFFFHSTRLGSTRLRSTFLQTVAKPFDTPLALSHSLMRETVVI